MLFILDVIYYGETDGYHVIQQRGWRKNFANFFHLVCQKV